MKLISTETQSEKTLHIDELQNSVIHVLEEITEQIKTGKLVPTGIVVLVPHEVPDQPNQYGVVEGMSGNQAKMAQVTSDCAERMKLSLVPAYLREFAEATGINLTDLVKL